MDLSLLSRKSDVEWWIEPHGRMRVPGIVFGTESLVKEMDEKVYEQVTNVATLRGIVRASYAMPDAHWGYGFSIGGVAAFDADQGGVISAGGVGFDISCGVRLLSTGLTRELVEPLKKRLAAYRAQTAPLVAYYAQKGSLRSVDGMTPIPEVAAAIDTLLNSPTAAAGTGGARAQSRSSVS